MELEALLTPIAIFFGMGLTVPLMIKYVAGVSQSMSQASLNSQQEGTRIAKEG